MLKTLAFATLFSTALVGSSALGADNPAVPKDQPSQPGQASSEDAQPDRNQSAATDRQTPSDVNFVTAQEKTQWRAPKLVGVGVYGPDDKQIGKIDDLLIDHNGAVQTVVIGVGGFLGFGKKDVAVPFAAMQWRTEGRKVPATDQPPANSVASTNGAGSQQPPMKETDPAATEASQGYPDKAILNMTLAQLKAAPDFLYAPSPLAEFDTRPAGGGEMMKSQPHETSRGEGSIVNRRSGRARRAVAWICPAGRTEVRCVRASQLKAPGPPHPITEPAKPPSSAAGRAA